MAISMYSHIHNSVLMLLITSTCFGMEQDADYIKINHLTISKNISDALNQHAVINSEFFSEKEKIKGNLEEAFSQSLLNIKFLYSCKMYFIYRGILPNGYQNKLIENRSGVMIERSPIEIYELDMEKKLQSLFAKRQRLVRDLKQLQGGIPSYNSLDSHGAPMDPKDVAKEYMQGLMVYCAEKVKSKKPCEFYTKDLKKIGFDSITFPQEIQDIRQLNKDCTKKITERLKDLTIKRYNSKDHPQQFLIHNAKTAELFFNILNSFQEKNLRSLEIIRACTAIVNNRVVVEKNKQLLKGGTLISTPKKEERAPKKESQHSQRPDNSSKTNKNNILKTPPLKPELPIPELPTSEQITASNKAMAQLIAQEDSKKTSSNKGKHPQKSKSHNASKKGKNRGNEGPSIRPTLAQKTNEGKQKPTQPKPLSQELKTKSQITPPPTKRQQPGTQDRKQSQPREIKAAVLAQKQQSKNPAGNKQTQSSNIPLLGTPIQQQDSSPQGTIQAGKGIHVDTPMKSDTVSILSKRNGGAKERKEKTRPAPTQSLRQIQAQPTKQPSTTLLPIPRDQSSSNTSQENNGKGKATGIDSRQPQFKILKRSNIGNGGEAAESTHDSQIQLPLAHQKDGLNMADSGINTLNLSNQISQHNDQGKPSHPDLIDNAQGSPVAPPLESSNIPKIQKESLALKIKNLFSNNEKGKEKESSSGPIFGPIIKEGKEKESSSGPIFGPIIKEDKEKESSSGPIFGPIIPINFTNSGTDLLVPYTTRWHDGNAYTISQQYGNKETNHKYHPDTKEIEKEHKSLRSRLSSFRSIFSTHSTLRDILNVQGISMDLFSDFSRIRKDATIEHGGLIGRQENQILQEKVKNLENILRLQGFEINSSTGRWEKK